VPAEVRTLNRCERLWVNNNRLAALPDEIGHMKSLRELMVQDNALAALPDTLMHLHSLETLWAGHNQLATLCMPRALGNFTALTDLRLHGNPVEDAELELLKLGPHHVQRLNARLLAALDGGALHAHALSLYAVPSRLLAVDTHPNLTHLSLADNRLQELPSSVRALRGLLTLDVSRNFLSALPPELAGMQLSTLQLRGNRFLSVPAVRRPSLCAVCISQMGCTSVQLRGPLSLRQQQPRARSPARGAPRSFTTSAAG